MEIRKLKSFGFSLPRESREIFAENLRKRPRHEDGKDAKKQKFEIFDEKKLHQKEKICRVEDL